jgi:hypothetical protein
MTETPASALTNGAPAADGPIAGTEPAASTPRAGGAPASAAAAQTFGRLEAVQLRRYWQDEARHFTPWLAKEENLTLLGETVGMNLELVAVEQYIGPFRADIIA